MLVVLVYMLAGKMLLWALYALAKQPALQQKLHEEITSVLLPSQGPTFDVIVHHMPYLNAVINETLRWSVLAPWAARVSDTDLVISGYTVPAGTPVVQALGVVLQDPALWPEPETFDPERFMPAGVAPAVTPTAAFAPFGFAGKRICPGYKFAVVEAGVVLIELLRRFRLKLVPDQPAVTKMYGLVTNPSVDINVLLEQR